jgi:hypothetical protein
LAHSLLQNDPAIFASQDVMTSIFPSRPHFKNEPRSEIPDLLFSAFVCILIFMNLAKFGGELARLRYGVAFTGAWMRGPAAGGL